MTRAGAALVLTASISLGLALAACSSTTSGAPSGTPVRTVPSSPSAEVPAAPAVDRPLDLYGIAGCAVLSPEKLQALDLLPRSAADESNGNASACSWTSTGESFNATVALSGARDLRLFYRMRETFNFFEPESVGGYPAVRVSDANSGSCLILVGNADDQSFSAQVGGLGGPQQDWCEVARRVAGAVLTSLPPRR
jgi:hypothetical protein